MKLKFKPNTECDYKHNYERIFKDIANGHLPEKRTYRTLVLNDLWFVVYFVMGVSVANHPFWVEACKEVEGGPESETLDLWAREHGKSTIITTAETLQKILRDPERRVGIFSHTRPAAKAFLRGLKHILENNKLLKACFEKELYEKPDTQSPKWSEDDGLIIRRQGVYREATLEAWGLLEGMPVGKHFTDMIFDDIVTADLVNNPETMNRLKDAFDLSLNLLVMNTGRHRVIGTHYHHEDPLMYLREKKDIHGKPIYTTRIKTATSDGTPNGEPVLLSQEALDKLKSNEYIFNCQQLLNPTPVSGRKLDSEMLQEIENAKIPHDVEYFMVADPAGDNKDRKGNRSAWAILVVGVRPTGGNTKDYELYLVDGFISPCGEDEAVEEAVRLYLRNGPIQRIGSERAGMSTFDNHVKKALEAKGRRVSYDNKTLKRLTHANMKKEVRVERSLAWPLHNSKIFMSNTFPVIYGQRLRNEMDKFPFWHMDGIDALSNIYQLIEDYRFVPQHINAELLKAANEAAQCAASRYVH